MRRLPRSGSGELTESPFRDRQTEVPETPIVTCGFEDIDDPNVDGKVVPQGATSGKFQFGHQSRLRLHLSLLHQLMGRGEEPVLQYYDTTVYRSDLSNLYDDEWLNDNNISFLYEYLERTRLKEYHKNGKIVLLRPSMAYLLRHTDDPSSLKPVLPNLDRARFIFLPINDNPDVSAIEGGAHWSLLVVSTMDKKTLYYDTMHRANYQVSMQTSMKLGQLLGSQLGFVVLPTPQQINMSDCGVLVCEITALLLFRLLNIKPANGNKVDFALDNVYLIASAGRSFMLTVILELIHDYSGIVREKD